MITLFNDLHPAFAIVPMVGALAIRDLWSRIQLQSDLRAREERLEIARRETMRALREAQAATEAAQKSREEFLARMSHELRTPLNAVIGLSRVLEKNGGGNQRPQDLQLLSRVRASGELLLKLIEDVLEQSRLQSAQLVLDIGDTDVVAIATYVVDQFRPVAAAKGLRVLSVVPDAAQTVRLDDERFGQVLHHLMENAVKFTAAGMIKVSLLTDAQGRPSRVIVSDSGIGIPESELGRIFQPFSQIDEDTTRSYAGAGLGLPLARQLCDAMNCRLAVESEVGKGSRFTVTFPKS